MQSGEEGRRKLFVGLVKWEEVPFNWILMCPVVMAPRSPSLHMNLCAHVRMRLCMQERVRASKRTLEREDIKTGVCRTKKREANLPRN